MPYFLEYVTGATAGRFAVEGADVGSALVKAEEALRGVGCIRAVLLYSPDVGPGFGKGSIVATYTQAKGWTNLEE